MTACICDISSLELIRASGQFLPELISKPRTSKLAGCTIPDRITLADDMDRLGVRTLPYHLACGERSAIHKRDDANCHLLPGKLPARSLIRLSRNMLTVGPELLFLQLAAHSELDDIELAQIGYELCGSYVLDASWDGFTNLPATTTCIKKIARIVDGCPGFHGVKQARRVLRLLHDGSNSPMETVLALLLSLPPRYGGMNLGPMRLNQRIVTSDGPRWVDLMFHHRGVGLEYKGRRSHSIEKTGRDDRRQNKLTSMGITIINVWYEDIASDVLFQELASDVLRALGVRPQRRGEAFLAKQSVLRAQVLPSFRRYANLD